MPKHPQADIALLTDRRYTASTAPEGDWYLRNILHDDALLQNALAKIGLSSVRVDWADPDVDWPSFRCAVFRTTWDYYERISEFTTWLKHTATKVRLCNDPSIIWWNLDKHYLSDLQNRGIPTVPSRYITPGGSLSLPELLEDTGWDEAVVKPCISAGAYHTWRIRRDNAAAVQATLQPVLDEKTFIIQPFLHDILHSGEDTLMIIDGRFTHAIKKRPKAGDFRVQDDYGGTVHPLRPDPEQIRLAERAMAACGEGLPNKPGYADELPSEKTSGQNPVYGRVDAASRQTGQGNAANTGNSTETVFNRADAADRQSGQESSTGDDTNAPVYGRVDAASRQTGQGNAANTGNSPETVFNRVDAASRQSAKESSTGDNTNAPVYGRVDMASRQSIKESSTGDNTNAPVYGRVDMARDNDGQWVVMELELIEPELWLREEPSSAEIFAAAIARVVY